MAILTRALRSGSDGPEEPNDAGQMSLVEHLRELRRRVIISVLAVALGGVLGFVLYDPVIDILKEPYTDITGRTSFIVFDPLEQFTTRFKVSAYVGLLVAGHLGGEVDVPGEVGVAGDLVRLPAHGVLEGR